MVALNSIKPTGIALFLGLSHFVVRTNNLGRGRVRNNLLSGSQSSSVALSKVAVNMQVRHGRSAV